MQQKFLQVYNQVKDIFCQRRNPRQQRKSSLLNPFISSHPPTQKLLRVPTTTFAHRPDTSNPSQQFNSKDSKFKSSNGVPENIQMNSQKREANSEQKIRSRLPSSGQYKIAKWSQLGSNENSQQNTMIDSEEDILSEELIGFCIDIDQKTKACYEEFSEMKKDYEQFRQQQYKLTYGQDSNNQSQNSQEREIESFLSESQEESSNKHQASIYNKTKLRYDYEKDILQTIECKYSGQRQYDYPLISYQLYLQVRKYWMGLSLDSDQSQRQIMSDQSVIRKMERLKSTNKLTYRSIKTLAWGSWLNDEIINGYLELLECCQVNKIEGQNMVMECEGQQLIGTSAEYRILNSYFAETTLSKTPDLIIRSLKRKNITPSNPIVIALNNGNHWFFARIKDSRVTIYDSIAKGINYYQNNANQSSELLKNIIKFANWFYYSSSRKEEHILEIDESYPQQQNGYDCGMFLLCGIKDVIRKENRNGSLFAEYDKWTFDRYDIRYKRVQVALELLNEQIM